MNAQKTPEASAPRQAQTTEQKKSIAGGEDSGAKEFTAEDVAKHTKKDDVWVIVNGQVLDVTKVRVACFCLC